MDLSFPVDISAPSTTPAPMSAEAHGRPFDDLLDDGLAQALAAASVTASSHAAPPLDGLGVENPNGLGTALAGVEALTATGHDTAHAGAPSPTLANVSAGAELADLVATAAQTPPDAPATLTGSPDGTIPPTTTRTTTAAPDPGLGSTAAGTAIAATTTDTVASTTAADAHASTMALPEPSGPTAATNQAQAVGSTAPRALDPARVAITRQSPRSAETPGLVDTGSDAGSDAGSTSVTAVGSTPTTPTTDPAETIDVADSTGSGADVTPAANETAPRSGGGDARPGSADGGVSGSDTLGAFATDKVRYLRDMAPAREIQRLAIDLDDARVAVRFAEGAAMVDVMSDPSSRLDSGWVSNVERTLRQLDRPVDPTTAGDPSHSTDNREHQDADSRGQDTRHHHLRHDEQPQPSIDDERIRRWQDATRSLMTTPTTRN